MLGVLIPERAIDLLFEFFGIANNDEDYYK
jgi:hypothetical protein